MMSYLDLHHLRTDRLQTVEEIELLQTIILDLGDAPNFRSALGAVLRRVCEKTDWELGLAWLPDIARTELQHCSTWLSLDHKDGLEEFTRASEQATFRLGEGLPGRVWLTKKAAWILDASTETNFPRSNLARKSGLKTGLAIPILFKEDVVAVIEFFVRERHRENVGLIKLITAVAAQLGLMIQRMRAEDALRISEARYRTLMQNAPVCIHEIDEHRKLIAINRAGLKMLGMTDENQVYEVSALDLVSLADRQRVQDLLDQAFTGGFSEFEFVTGSSTDARTFLSSLMPIRDEDGAIRRLVGISQDITDHKRTQEQLRQAQKMEAVGRLAGGVAHDFNNLLGVIRGYSEMLLESPGVSGSVHTKIEQIHKAAVRAASLTHQLLAFSHNHIIRPMIVDLNAIVNDTSQMLRRLIGENIDLTLCLDPHLGSIRVNQGSIDQVLLNLVVNARDALPKGGTVTVQTSNVQLDQELAVYDHLVAPGRYVVLTVKDNGTGIDSNTQAHMFEPFFTTKENGKGTGLGLATIYGIIKQSNGGIRVHSILGEGTTFEIFFPCVETSANTGPDVLALTTQAVPQASIPAEQISSHTYHDATEKIGVPALTETVVVVEDCTPLRKLTCEFLESFGYPVLDFESGPDAIQTIAEFNRPISVLITDVIMPGMNGFELANQLLNIRPTLKVLFISGYTNNEIACQGTLTANQAFVQKPFTRSDLSQSMHDLLRCSA